MKDTNKYHEMLSAYIDGELLPEEENEIEEKLISSNELKKKYEELKRIKKLTVSSIKKVEENPFFETRVNAALNFSKTGRNKIRKFYPAIGITLVTVILMVVLKLNPNLFDEIVEQQKTNITGFYKENMRPLLLTAGFTNEDIFNFAFSKHLPLDKENNQYLQLGSEPDGENYFEIKTAGIIPELDNFENFVKALKLNSRQKDQMDSILGSYIDDLQDQVLVNEKQTVAINPNLWNYHKAIFADIMAFAKDANKNQFNKIVPAGYSFHDRPAVVEYVNRIKTNQDSQYIFFTPDSVFTTTFKFDKDKFKVEMDGLRKELRENKKNLDKHFKEFNLEVRFDSNFVKFKNDSSRNKNFRIMIGSNLCRVELQDIKIPDIELPDFDSFNAQIEAATKHLKNFSFRIPHFDGDNKFRFEYDDGDSARVFEFKMPDVDSIIKSQSHFFNFDNDSLASFKFFMNDSTFFNHKEFRKEMEKMRKEMKKMRNDMQNLRKEIKYEFKEGNSLEI